MANLQFYWIQNRMIFSQLTFSQYLINDILGKYCTNICNEGVLSATIHMDIIMNTCFMDNAIKLCYYYLVQLILIFFTKMCYHSYYVYVTICFDVFCVFSGGEMWFFSLQCLLTAVSLVQTDFYCKRRLIVHIQTAQT